MNLIPISLRSRLLAIGILAACLTIAWVILCAPILSRWQDQQEELERSTRLLSAYRTARASRPALEEKLRQLQQQGASTAGLVEGTSAALAAAKLQSDLRSIVEANAGQVRSTQNLPSVTKDDFEKVSIGSDFSIPMGHLKALVYQIETHSPFLFIDKVEIRMPETWQPVDENTLPPSLEIRWVVSGYRWAGAK